VAKYVTGSTGDAFVNRRCDGFHQDESGDWVAELSCLHGQHVRHQPPFRDRAWVLTAAGRAQYLGTRFDCPLCDRCEMPDGLVLARTAGPFDGTTAPAGLRRPHRIAPRTWGVLRVLDGVLRFALQTDPEVVTEVRAGDHRAIPPDVPHRVDLDGPVTFELDFLVRR
jgi:tellurite methyltransferase